MEYEIASPALPDAGKVDVARRLDIVAACVGALQRDLPRLADAELRLAEYKKSSLVVWCVGITAVALLLGQYVLSWFYVVAVFAAGTYVQRTVDVIRFEHRRDKYQERISDIRTLWTTTGLFSNTLDSLISLWRKSVDDASLDSDEYGDWWHEAARLTEAKVRSTLR